MLGEGEFLKDDKVWTFCRKNGDVVNLMVAQIRAVTQTTVVVKEKPKPQPQLPEGV